MSRELENPACRRRLTGLTAAPCLAALLLAACGSEHPATSGNGPDPVTVLLTADPASGDIPLRVTLNWSATHVTDCDASGGWSGERPFSGNESITLDTAGVHDFTLNCDGPSGPLSQQVTVTASDAFGEARSEFERLRTLENRTLF